MLLRMSGERWLRAAHGIAVYQVPKAASRVLHCYAMAWARQLLALAFCWRFPCDIRGNVQSFNGVVADLKTDFFSGEPLGKTGKRLAFALPDSLDLYPVW